MPSSLSLCLVERFVVLIMPCLPFHAATPQRLAYHGVRPEHAQTNTLLLTATHDRSMGSHERPVIHPDLRSTRSASSSPRYASQTHIQFHSYPQKTHCIHNHIFRQGAYLIANATECKVMSCREASDREGKWMMTATPQLPFHRPLPLSARRARPWEARDKLKHFNITSTKIIKQVASRQQTQSRRALQSISPEPVSPFSRDHSWYASTTCSVHRRRSKTAVGIG